MVRIIIFGGFILAFILRSDLVLIVSSILYCSLYLIKDFWPLRINRLDISSVYPIGLLLNSVSHLIAIISNPEDVKYYLLLYKQEFLFEGLAIFHIGSVIIMETMRMLINDSGALILVERMRFRYNWNYMMLGSIGLFFVTNLTPIGSLGSIETAAKLLLFGTIMYLSIYVHYNNERGRITLLILYVGFLSFWALRYSYLRYEILLPWFAYFLGEGIARKRFTKFSNQSKIVIVILAISIPPIFTFLGKERSSLIGNSDKVGIVLKGARQAESLEGGETIMSRLSYINQLTHLVNLTEKNGFYDGESLAYFKFVFIPRILWSEKPLVMQGQWFGLETGLAYKLKSGRANSSINMTVPGEFYLNFGWWGVLIGCFIFGAILSFIWNTIRGNDFFSLAFQFYLLFVSMAGLGADLQVIVTIMAYFLIYKAYDLTKVRDSLPLVKNGSRYHL
jgi:hypothetical protein